jgi:hypothetical protein
MNANLFSDLGIFIARLFDHLFTLLAGCVVTVVVGIIEKRILKRPISWRLDVYILLGFIFFAGFQAWQDQYHRAQTASVYVETHIEPANTRLQFLVLDYPISARFIWTRTGSDVASNVVNMPMIYVEPDHSMKTQQKITADLQRLHNERLAGNASQHIEGPTLGFSDGSKAIWGTPPHEAPVLTKSLYSELWDGSKIVFYAAVVSYEAPSGLKYESHFCNYLQPLNLNDLANRGKPLPEPIPVVSLSFVECDMFNDTIKKR